MLCCSAICVLHVKMQWPEGYSRIAEVSMSILPNRGSRTTAADTRAGSSPNTMRDVLIA